MDEFINKIKTNDGKEYTVTDNRFPEPTVEDAGKVVTIDENGNFCLALSDQDNLEDLLNNELTEINYKETIGSIRPYIFNNNQTLRSFSIAGVEAGIGTYAFTSSESLNNLSLGIVNGEIGDYAFAGLVNVNHFSLDSESNITKLGTNAFGGIGADRNSAERFVFDFRNSTFKGFQGFGIPTIPGSTDGQGQVLVEEVPGIGMYNADIYLPETVIAFGKDPEEGSGSSYGGGSGSGGILNCCENIDLYITNREKVLELSDLSLLPEDENSHVYVPFEIYADYSLATNWAAFENLIGYIENSVVDSILPLYDTEGFELAWYKDKALTEATTLGTGDNVYCTKTGIRLRSKVILGNAYKGTVEITSAGGSHELGELIPVNTEITITPVCTELGEPVLNIFKLNGENYTEAVTLTLAEDNIIADVYYNVPEVPAYLKLENERSYSPTSEMNTIAYNSSYSGELPSHIDIMPFYIKDGNIYEVKYLKYSIFSNKLQNKDYYVTLPETLIGSLNSSCFSGCTGLKSINIPSSITAIGSQTFYQCSNLEDIGILPKSITYISTQGFGACPKLTSKNIYYEGKPGKLDAYVPGGSPDSTSNKPFKNALCYYSEEAPTDCSGTYKYWHYIDGEPTVWPEPEHEPMDPVQENYVLPTCEEDGGYDEVIYCKYCHKEFSREHIVIPATGHEWGEWKTIEEPIHCHTGLKHRICQHDNTHVQEEAIPAPEPHTAGEIVIENRVEPTFEADGGYDEVSYCTNCSQEVSRNHVVIPHLEHNYSDKWSYDENIHWHACTDAGYEDLRGDEAAHIYETVSVIKPTEFEYGYTVKRCSICGKEVETDYVNPTSIDEETLDTDFSFIKENNSYTITSFNRSIPEDDVVIPSVYKNKLVTKIEQNVFKNNTNIKSMSIPATIESISEGLLSGCYNVESLVLPFTGPQATYDVNKRYNLGYIFGYTQFENTIKVQYSSWSGGFTYYIPSKLAIVTINNKHLDTLPLLAFYQCSMLAAIKLNAPLKNLMSYAFESCSLLETIDLPDTVELIDSSCFEDCSKLSRVNGTTALKSANNYAFRDCSNLISINTDNLEEIKEEVFAGCSSLSIISLPKIKSIDSRAFKNCTKLTSVSFGNDLQTAANYIFDGCTKLGQDIEGDIYFGNELNPYVYLYKFRTIVDNSISVLPGCRVLGSNCSQELRNGRVSSITTVNLPTGLIEIGAYAFQDYSALTNIILPDTVIRLGTSAFQNCTALVNINLPASLVKISGAAFYGCRSLENLVLPQNLKTIGREAFNYCKLLTTIEIPESVETIDSYAFCSCQNLQTVTFAKNCPVTYLDGVFMWCSNLKTVIFNDSIRYIPKEFTRCYALENITLPASVTEIGFEAFRDCTSLEAITYLSTIQDWQAIIFGKDWMLDSALTTVHCTDGDIQL